MPSSVMSESTYSGATTPTTKQQRLEVARREARAHAKLDEKIRKVDFQLWKTLFGNYNLEEDLGDDDDSEFDDLVQGEVDDQGFRLKFLDYLYERSQVKDLEKKLNICNSRKHDPTRLQEELTAQVQKTEELRLWLTEHNTEYYQGFKDAVDNDEELDDDEREYIRLNKRRLQLVHNREHLAIAAH